MGLFGRITNLIRGAFSGSSTDSFEDELRAQALKKELERPPAEARRKAKEQLANLRDPSQSESADLPIDTENKPPKKRTL